MLNAARSDEGQNFILHVECFIPLICVVSIDRDTYCIETVPLCPLYTRNILFKGTLPGSGK